MKGKYNVQLIEAIEGTFPQQMDLLRLQHELPPEVIETWEDAVLVAPGWALHPIIPEEDRSINTYDISKQIKIILF